MKYMLVFFILTLAVIGTGPLWAFAGDWRK